MRRSAIALASAALLVSSLGSPAQADPGSLDKFFAGDGRQTAFPQGATGYAVAIDKQGRIVVAGYTLTAKTDFALARFLPNGNPDPDFGGGDGRVTQPRADGLRLRRRAAVRREDRRGRRARPERLASSPWSATASTGSWTSPSARTAMSFVGFGKKYQGANAVVIGAAGTSCWEGSRRTAR